MASREKPHDEEEEIEERSSRSVNDESDGSLSFSDADDRSWHSPLDSNGGSSSSYDEYRFSNGSGPVIGGVTGIRRNSSVTDCASEVDLDSAVTEIKVHVAKYEKDCRICHLSLESVNHESGIPIELGCSCKEDLAAAHKQCAEAWFKIRGNKTCEICGSTACNVVVANETEVVDQWNETSNPAPVPPVETRSFWNGHRFLNFLLACMVFAFVISWLFHFNVPS
eukprot:TRINITY_DN8348_c0_g1_i1.p1 TRINITY_DN8348_c0_g1~~TRINITY_DN8348_c0_g1_i1.p1  ORF type:complete len:224 (+),score=25.30 TRINITY_DN8348_c0_g1_i1:131-802(+)